MKKKIVLCGAFGGANVGDEVIFHADLELAKTRGFTAPFGVLTFVPPSTAAAQELYNSPDLEAVYIKNAFAALRLAWGAQLFIGGGQVLDGAYGAKPALVKMVLAMAARLGGGRVVVGGAGAFKIEGIFTRFAYGVLFALCCDIALRDQASYDEISYASGTRKKGRVAADIVFSLRQDLTRRACGTRDQVGFAVHCAPHTQFMQLDDAARMVAALWKQHGEALSILVHDNRPEFDLDFAHAIAAKAKEAHGCDDIRVQVLDEVEACLNYYASAELIVSARMHPLIIGSLGGARCIPLKGSRKVDQFAQLVGLDLAAQDDAAGFEEAIANARQADGDKMDELEKAAQTLMDGFA